MGKAAPFDKREPSRRCRQLKNQILTHYRRIRNIRQDFMKRTAHTIAQKYGWVAMENLKLKNMTKSAKGTVEDPGRNVKQKSGLNRSLARVAPYGMRMAILVGLVQGRRTAHPCRSEVHEPDLSQVRIHEFIKSTYAGAFRLPTLRLH